MSAADDDKRSLAWCFTINNYTEKDIKQVKSLAKHKHNKYVVAGFEVGASGTPHIQGYCFMTCIKSRAQMSKLLNRASLRWAKGSAEQNFDYCTKDGDLLIESGVRSMSQKRKGECGADHWKETKRLAIEGRLLEIDDKTFVTHFPNLLKISSHYAPMPADLESLDNEWYHGSTGTGKSYKARTENPGAYLKMCNKWWDGYQNEEVVIIEDFDKVHSVLGHHLKIWADRYAFPAEIKGAKVNLRPKKIIVTSNYSPSEVWSDQATLDPILRRFNLFNFDNPLFNKD